MLLLLLMLEIMMFVVVVVLFQLFLFLVEPIEFGSSIVARCPWVKIGCRLWSRAVLLVRALRWRRMIVVVGLMVRWCWLLGLLWCKGLRVYVVIGVMALLWVHWIWRKTVRLTWSNGWTILKFFFWNFKIIIYLKKWK